MSDPLTELGRRVLGHLPVWAKNEKAHVKAEGGPKNSIRSYGLADFTVRLAEDPEAVVTDEAGVTRHMTEAEVEQTLQALADTGLASSDDEGQWRMTEAGYDALVTPQQRPDQTPGAVTMNLHPAKAKADGGLIS